MTDSGELRIWLGWRKPDVQAGGSGWDAFMRQLRQRFIPATWRVMPRFGLTAYVPSVLRPQGDGLPDEVALLAYTSRPAYAAHKQDPLGKAYSEMHDEVFSFAAGAAKSRSLWAERDTTLIGRPRRRSAATGEAVFNQAHARVHFLALHGGPSPGPEALMAALQSLTGEVVVWCEPSYSLVWLASGQELARADVHALLLPLMPGASIRAWHAAHMVSSLPDTGVDLPEDSSLHFAEPGSWA